MNTDCPNLLHDHPLPSAYIAASDEADERLAAKWRNLKCPDCGLYGWKPPATTEHLRTCRYCGRTGQKQFTRMHDGQWRCKSSDYCQRRARKRYRVSAGPHGGEGVFIDASLAVPFPKAHNTFGTGRSSSND